MNFWSIVVTLAQVAVKIADLFIKSPIETKTNAALTVRQKAEGLIDKLKERKMRRDFEREFKVKP